MVFTPEQIKAATIIDVRTPEEYASGHVVGAININLFGPTIQKDILALPKDKTYFVYCQSGGRSSQVAGFMAAQGFTKVENLGGVYDAASTLELPLKQGSAK